MSVLKIDDDLFTEGLEFYDYHTEVFDGKNPVDTHKTGVQFYNDFLSTEGRKRKQETNLTGTIVLMSPSEYYHECATKIFGSSVNRLKQSREHDKEVISHLIDVLTKYKRKLCLPIINYAQTGQEGLHRMYAIAKLFGWDYRVPVLVVNWIDEDAQIRKEQTEKQDKIDYKVNRAIGNVLEFTYTELAELEDQLVWELEKQFQYEDDIQVPQEISLVEKQDQWLFTFLDHEYTIDKSELDFKPNNNAQQIDDLSDDDIEELLLRYFGEDWRETNPHLKDKFELVD